MGGACSTYGAERGAHRVLVGKPEARRTFETPRHRWEDNIKIKSSQYRRGGGGENCIYLTQDIDKWRVVVNAVITC
jgi:hypothetical protein